MDRYKTSLLILFFTLLTAKGWSYSTNPRTNDSIPAADTLKYWSSSGLWNLNFNQNSISNWASGGESSLSGSTFFNRILKYQKANLSFENSVTLNYGMIWNKEDQFRKNDDKIELTTKVGYKAVKNWHYTFQANLKTQFDKGYKYPNDSIVVSRFFAPAYLTLTLGMDYKPFEFLSLLISPASGKFTFVTAQVLADKGSYGVTPAQYDAEGKLLKSGNNTKSEFGMAFDAKLNKELCKNIKLSSVLNLHNNYFDEDHQNRWNFDINWENYLNFVINKYLTSSIHLHMIYDHDIQTPDYEIQNNEKVEVGRSPKLQFKESFGLGFSFKF